MNSVFFFSLAAKTIYVRIGCFDWYIITQTAA